MSKLTQGIYSVTLSRKEGAASLSDMNKLANALRINLIRRFSKVHLRCIGLIIVSQNDQHFGTTCVSAQGKKGFKSFGYQNEQVKTFPHLHIVLYCDGPSRTSEWIEGYFNNKFNHECSVRINKVRDTREDLEYVLNYVINQHYKFRSFTCGDYYTLDLAEEFLTLAYEITERTGSYQKMFVKEIAELKMKRAAERPESDSMFTKNDEDDEEIGCFDGQQDDTVSNENCTSENTDLRDSLFTNLSQNKAFKALDISREKDSFFGADFVQCNNILNKYIKQKIKGNCNPWDKGKHSLANILGSSCRYNPFVKDVRNCSNSLYHEQHTKSACANNQPGRYFKSNNQKTAVKKKERVNTS